MQQAPEPAKLFDLPPQDVGWEGILFFSAGYVLAALVLFMILGVTLASILLVGCLLAFLGINFWH